MSQREIRFRAWDKKRNKWAENIEIYGDGSFNIGYFLEGGGLVGADDIAIDGIVFDKKRDAILMQFTGLKDKNDKPIYEGDILVWHNQTGEPDSDIEPVRFEGGCFGCGNDLLGELDLDSIEVIGNIYENPELLEGK